jgi:hypothetical protein
VLARDEEIMDGIAHPVTHRPFFSSSPVFFASPEATSSVETTLRGLLSIQVTAVIGPFF